MIPVEASFLYSIREQSSFTWKSMICELIDNAFDANATRVDLRWPGGQVFEVQDNGVGTDNLMRLITLGQRYDHESNDIGKYGVGCKQALIWLWGVSELSSYTKAAQHHLEIAWDSIASGSSQYPTAADIQTSLPTGATGTRLRCRATRSYPKFDALFSSIASTYTPGIELGRQISVARNKEHAKCLTGRRWPATSKEVQRQIEAAGRLVDVRMGIVAEGERNPYTHGFSFERTYRVIKESTLGANGFAVSRLAARITLSKEWDLSTNKDDFSDYQDELAEALYESFYDLMKEASEQAISHEDEEFNRELAALVLDDAKASKTRKEKRPGGGSTEGTVSPKETGRRRQRADKSTDNPGSVIDDIGEKAKRRGFTIEQYEDETQTFGEYDPDGNRLRLNMSNEWLKTQYRLQNQDALLPVMYGIFAHHDISKHGKHSPLFRDEIEGGFCELWGARVDRRSRGVMECQS